jgi:hypothetical protein
MMDVLSEEQDKVLLLEPRIKDAKWLSSFQLPVYKFTYLFIFPFLGTGTVQVPGKGIKLLVNLIFIRLVEKDIKD